MKVKELIEELQKIENKELEVYVHVADEVEYWGGEKGALIEDKYIEKVELGYQPNYHGLNEPCVILD